MRRAFIALIVVMVVFLAGCGPEPSPTPIPTLEPSPTVPAFTAEPPPPPTASFVPDSTDTMTLVLGGYFLRGGYWSWDDISNLLGYYATYGAYDTVELEGQTYTGVPLEYLLNYAEYEDGVMSFIFFGRGAGNHPYPIEDVIDCEDCLIARMPDDTLTLILPGQEPSIVEDLVRIEVR